MTADPYDPISKITEMSDGEVFRLLGAFFRAVGWGALAGGGIFLFLTVPIAIGMAADGQIPRAVGVALLPLGIAGAGSLAGMILIGLPTTAILRLLRKEGPGIYALIGMLTGFLLPSLLIALVDSLEAARTGAGLVLGIFGALAGGVAGNVWGDHRQFGSARDAPPIESGEIPDHSRNPFHDMMY